MAEDDVAALWSSISSVIIYISFFFFFSRIYEHIDIILKKASNTGVSTSYQTGCWAPLNPFCCIFLSPVL